jgi:hypothetical protein
MYVADPGRQAQSELRLAALRLGLQVLRKRDRRCIEPAGFLGVTAAAVIFAALGAWLFERRDLSA